MTSGFGLPEPEQKKEAPPHGRGEVLPAPDQWPGLTGVHCESKERPSFALNVPALQAVGKLEPTGPATAVQV